MSELYELPDGWEWKKLSDIGKISTGKTPPKANKEFYENGTIRFVKPPNLQNSIDVTKTESDEFITEDGAKKSTLLPKNSLMVCCIGSLGKFALSTENVITNQQINSIVFNNEVINYKYGYYYGFMFEKLLNCVANEAVVKIVNKTIYSNLNIPLPPLSEQQRIVSKLDLLFVKIDKSIALHQKNMDEADVFMGSVLNDVFGELEEKYENDILKNISNIISGYAFKSSDFSNYNEIKSIKITNVGVKEFVEDEENRLSKDLLEKLSKYTVNSGDIVIALTRPYISNGLKVTFVPNSYNGAFVNQRVAAIQSKNNISLINYIYYYLCTSNILTNVMELSKTLNQPNLSIKDLSNFEIPTPSLNIQQKVVKYLDEISEKIEKIKSIKKEKMDSLKALKASILDKAFRGEL